MGAHVAVTAISAVGLLTAAGCGTGLGTAPVTGEGGYVWEMIVAHVAHTPGVLVVMGVATSLLGVLPPAVNVVWVVPVYAMLVGFFGPMLDMSEWMPNLSPLNHIAHEHAQWQPHMSSNYFAANRASCVRAVEDQGWPKR